MKSILFPFFALFSFLPGTILGQNVVSKDLVIKYEDKVLFEKGSILSSQIKILNKQISSKRNSKDIPIKLDSNTSVIFRGRSIPINIDFTYPYDLEGLIITKAKFNFNGFSMGQLFAFMRITWFDRRYTVNYQYYGGILTIRHI
jgi:hypothetical protein